MCYRLLSNVRRYRTIQSLMGVIPQGHIVAQDVQHAHHLTENEHSVTVVTKLLQELIEQHHLATAHHQTLKRFLSIVRPIFCAIEKEWVVSRLLEFHRDVKQTDIVVAIGALDEPLVVLR